MGRVLVILLILSSVTTTLAHEGGAIPADVWTHWNTDPLMLTGLLLPLYLYVRGAGTYAIERWRILMVMGGTMALFVALISPLDAMSESLFSAHMVQHLLLVLVAAPLLALSRPLAPVLRGLPSNWRKGLGGLAHHQWIRTMWEKLTRPVGISAIHIAALWLWHLPGLYGAALADPFFHILEHASFFVTAFLYWWMIRSTEQYGGRVLSVFIVMMASGLLGALMLFSHEAWYAGHAPYVGAWGFTPLEDQQLAGLFMWIPAGIVYVVTAVALFGLWLNAVERRVVERENQLKKELRDA